MPRMLQLGELKLIQIAFQDRSHLLAVNFRDSFMNSNNLANQPSLLRTPMGGKNW
jgi:hypothetical protein